MNIDKPAGDLRRTSGAGGDARQKSHMAFKRRFAIKRDRFIRARQCGHHGDQCVREINAFTRAAKRQCAKARIAVLNHQIVRAQQAFYAIGDARTLLFMGAR